MVRRYKGELGTRGRELVGDRAVELIPPPPTGNVSAVWTAYLQTPPHPHLLCMCVLRVCAGVWARNHIV